MDDPRPHGIEDRAGAAHSLRMPPTMKLSLPAAASSKPPETGASMKKSADDPGFGLPSRRSPERQSSNNR